MQPERRFERLVLGIRQIQFVKRHQIGNVHRSFDRIHILFLQLKRLAQHFDHWNTHCGRDFETHTKSESPLAQRLLDRLQKVVGFILFDFDIGIARNAEWLAFQDRAARKQRSNVCRYEMLEQDELAGFVNTDQSRHITRNLHTGKTRLLFRGALHGRSSTPRFKLMFEMYGNG